jgi:hypothetical protein
MHRKILQLGLQAENRLPSSNPSSGRFRVSSPVFSPNLPVPTAEVGAQTAYEHQDARQNSEHGSAEEKARVSLNIFSRCASRDLQVAYSVDAPIN